MAQRRNRCRMYVLWMNCCLGSKHADSKSFKGQSPWGSCIRLLQLQLGNLEDMTFRYSDFGKKWDWIAAEDTRNTGPLLKYFVFRTKQISGQLEHNAKEKIPGFDWF